MTVAALAAVALAACGKKSANESTTDSVAAHADTTATAPAVAMSANTSTAMLGPDDIDRWQHGMDAELTAVHNAAAQLRNAKSSTDSLNALFAANETSTRAAGAKGAGVDEQRYQLIANKLASLAADMSPVEQEMDPATVPASVVKAMQHAREQSLAAESAGIDPALIQAMRPRAAALRKQALALAGERLKAAGMSR